MPKYLESVYHANVVIEEASQAAIRKHGQLQGGMDRWIHHLQEECREAVDEMHALDYYHSPDEYHAHKVALISELAQVAQLARSMVVKLFMGTEKEGEETWVTAADTSVSSLSKVDSGDQKPKGL